MSLRFVFGGSGAGKSTRIYTEILERAAKEPERNFLIIVPDQFTMQTQKELVTHPANKSHGILNIDVLSFGRLSHRIFGEVGKKDIPVLDDTGKSLVLRKVAGSLKNDLPYLGANLDKQGYIHEVKSAISEFMQYGIGVRDMDKLLDYAKNRGGLYYKLKDLKVLYEGFTEFIQDKYITTEETLDLLRDALTKSQIVKNSVIVFDGFTGFTPIQNRVIAQLMQLAKEVILTVTLDVTEDPFSLDGEQKLFHLSKKTVADMVKLAKESGIPRGDDIIVDYSGINRFIHNPALGHLESALFRYPVKPYSEDVTNQIHLSEASCIREEVRQTGIRMLKLIQDEGYKFRDMAVVAGDLEIYAEQIQTEFASMGIPCFVDRTRGIVLNPLIEYIKSSFEVILRNFSYVTVFQYLRSGLTDFTPNEIDILENYCIQTGIQGKKRWTNQFTRKTKQMKDDAEQFAVLEQLRQRLIQELEPLLSMKEKSAKAYVEALCMFLIQNRAAEKMAVFEKMFHENQENAREKEYAQVYRLVMELLEQIMSLLGDETMELREFKDILEAGFGEIEVGAIPQNVDRVLVGDMERTRLKEVKILFFLGLNDGNIPKSGGGGGIISDIDREFLRQSELELAPSPRQQMYIQKLYLYLNMTKPAKELYLSFSRVNSEGKALRPAYLVDVLKQIFPTLKVDYPELLPVLEQVMTPAEGMPYLAGFLREYAQYGENDNDDNLYTIYQAYQTDKEYEPILKLLTKAAFHHFEQGKLSQAVAKALYGQILRNSVTRLQTFASCAYRHFLQYGLSLQEREEFQFETVDMGNVFHGVLEGFSAKLEESEYTWFDFPESFAKKTVEEVLSLYTVEYGDTVLYSTARNEYAVRRMQRILERTVKTLQYQLKKGSFMPKKYELSFSSIADLDSLNIKLSEEEKMQLMGRIDRVDTCEAEDYLFVKIVDYKSGDKKFDLAALYYGLQLQLVVYLNAAMDLEKKLHPDKTVVPAAMLYYHVSDPAVEVTSEPSIEEINAAIVAQLRTNGVVNNDPDIVKRLDGETDKASDVIPVSFNKDGTLSARSSIMSTGDLSVVSTYVSKKIKQLGKEILEGDISTNPYEKGTEQACTYCPYQKVCGFDLNMPGCGYRTLKSMSNEQVMDAITAVNGTDI